MATPKKARKSARPARRKVTPEDLTRTRLAGDPQISPDGRRIVFVLGHVGDKNDKLTDLWVVDTPTSARGRPTSGSRSAGRSRKTSGAGAGPRRFTTSGKDSQPRWSPDGRQIAFVSRRPDAGGDERPQLWLIDAEGGEARRLTDFPEGSLGTLQWSPDGTRIAVPFRETAPEWTAAARKQREADGGSTPPRVIDSMFYRYDGDGYFQQQRHVLHLVDVADGSHRPVFSKDTLGHAEFSWTPDGKALVVTANTDRKALSVPWKTRFWRVDAGTGKATALPKLPAGTKEAPAVSPDGRSVAYAGSEGSERVWGENNTHLWLMDLKTGRHKGLTLQDDYCLAAKCISDSAEVNFAPTLAWAPDGRRVYLNFGWHGEMHVAAVDRKGGRVKLLTSGEQVLGMGNLSADGKLMALTVSTWDRPPEIAVGRVGRDRIDVVKLTDVNAWMSELQLSKPRAAWVTSTGGTKVHTWVMRPPSAGRAAAPRGGRTRKLPAVLEIHGGPHGQYGVGYFHEFQVLAAAGHAVFYSNPRGSKGYGEAFCAAIRGDWGSVDWDDIQAVRDHMQRQGFVDVGRMGIMGGSYGGYMTNWAIGHCDDFAGAITDRCVSNMVSMMGNSDIMEPPDGYWRGNTTDRPETLWEQSPLRYLGRCTTPTLIIHSEGDLRCNVEQAEQVHAVLCHNDVPNRFVRYPASTSHGMSRAGPPDLRIHRLHQILDWWKRWLRR